MRSGVRRLVSAAAWALAFSPVAAAAESQGTSIVVAGQPFDVGRPVVLWSDEQGFDGYQTSCIDQRGGCCDRSSPRFGARKGLKDRSLPSLQGIVSQLVLHFDGCVNSRSCFKSMHNRERPAGSSGCGLSAHFMIDSDGTIYQTLDLAERAFHAEQENSISVGVEICNRGRFEPNELPRLPAEYRTRPHKVVVINGEAHDAYEFRSEQYTSIIALARTLLRLFPLIAPVTPMTDAGAPLYQTLADPLSFRGVLGHLHVDMDRQKWDPGALDWQRIARALNAFFLPLQVRSFVEIPRTQADLVSARRAVMFNAEERASGFFPLAAGRLWHSGVHLRGAVGADVRAPLRGRLVAARRARVHAQQRAADGTATDSLGNDAASSTSFVLLAHEVDVGDGPFRFYTLLAHLDLPDRRAASGVPWVQALAGSPPAVREAYDAGQTILLDTRVEAGEVVGALGLVSRGPEQGPELHFEAFSPDRPPGAVGRAFRYMDAGTDQLIARRSSLVAITDSDSDGQLTGAEVRAFFGSGPLDRRQALRTLAVRHPHEWGDRLSVADAMSLRELGALTDSDRRALLDNEVLPYRFWTAELEAHVGLPHSQLVYSYHPLTLLMELAARASKIALPGSKGVVLGDRDVETKRVSREALGVWLEPDRAAVEPPLFGPPLGMRLAPKKKADIPLYELPPTDTR